MLQSSDDFGFFNQLCLNFNKHICFKFVSFFSICAYRNRDKKRSIGAQQLNFLIYLMAEHSLKQFKAEDKLNLSVFMLLVVDCLKKSLIDQLRRCFHIHRHVTGVQFKIFGSYQMAMMVSFMRVATLKMFVQTSDGFDG